LLTYLQSIQSDIQTTLINATENMKNERERIKEGKNTSRRRGGEELIKEEEEDEKKKEVVGWDTGSSQTITYLKSIREIISFIFKCTEKALKINIRGEIEDDQEREAKEVYFFNQVDCYLMLLFCVG